MPNRVEEAGGGHGGHGPLTFQPAGAKLSDAPTFYDPNVKTGGHS